MRVPFASVALVQWCRCSDNSASRTQHFPRCRHFGAASVDPRIDIRGGAFPHRLVATASSTIVVSSRRRTETKDRQQKTRLQSSASSTTESFMTPKPFTKNVNLPWVALSCLALWFMFVHAPSFWTQRQLWTRDTLLAVHIVAAGTIYMACLHNCLFTPSVSLRFWDRSSTSTTAATTTATASTTATSCLWAHTWVGRIGMIAGIISFSLGAFLAWTRLGMVGVGGTDLGFTLPITIGGLAQLASQYNGYTAIRKYKSLGREIETKTKMQHVEQKSVKESDNKDALAQQIHDLKVQQRQELRRHIGHMTGLFASACGIPAGIRIAEFVSGQRGGVVTWIAIAAVIWTLTKMGNLYLAIMMPERLQNAIHTSETTHH